MAIVEAALASVLTLWGVLALHVRAPLGRHVSRVFIGLLVLSATLFVTTRLFDSPMRVAGAGLFALAVTPLLAWWCTLRPSNARDWLPEVSRLLSSVREGRIVTLHNVRHFAWYGTGLDDDCIERWETRRYDLDRLCSVDLLLSSWGRPAIAHVMVSFGFADGRHLAFSVEIRRKRGDRFSELGGFFRQYERCIVAADEDDIVKVRTNLRGEEGELFRVKMTPTARVSLLEAYLEEANRLRDRPRFYNTLTANCTTLVFQMARRIVPGLPLDYRLLATGYLPDYLARIGALSGTHDMATYRRLGRFTERARASRPDLSHDLSHDPSHDLSPDPSRSFSRDIRRGVPGVADGSDETALALPR
ncbi:Lnb N-terminal periplasmic domain-containing protein [Chitinasiproducens palmae]|uniref:Lnb N-terminal periplasmic domain-containing protein n=1 Tax=Chitinasiproducens palmae TaxID=1770053 RepID=A0A1H2PJY5_9BURK|nr:DUF4105 domain-containing protein [Chitinasiproducens palmae]SDV46706.1 protein of unknown function [Chitinasiproducens palmae]